MNHEIPFVLGQRSGGKSSVLYWEPDGGCLSFPKTAAAGQWWHVAPTLSRDGLLSFLARARSSRQEDSPRKPYPADETLALDLHLELGLLVSNLPHD